MHTLQQLQTGELLGVKRLQLSCALKEFPNEIFSLADSLEILDLSGNNLSILPNNFNELKKLKILFLANNSFVEFPSVLASCEALSMIGFKSNRMEYVPENAFPAHLRWLILTDNCITKIPKSIGKCPLLQKCALAGNKIEELPEEMSNCKNLELLRISANHLKTIPDWLFELPRLSWIAFAGNPASYKSKNNNSLDAIQWNEFTLQQVLGEGASGIISKATWNTKQNEVAVKVFKGDVTSDGWPNDEMNAYIAAGEHHNLVKVLGKIKKHPDHKEGLVMELIPPSFSNLGNPPSLDSCSRDIFEQKNILSGSDILKIAKGIASVCFALHQKGINHGDLYAHNILFDNTANSFLGDFGAASFYDTNTSISHNIERIEVRAFGCLLEDLEQLLNKENTDSNFLLTWQQITKKCMQQNVSQRPSFKVILDEFNLLN